MVMAREERGRDEAELSKERGNGNNLIVSIVKIKKTNKKKWS